MAALLLSVAGAAAGGAVFGPVGAIAGRIAGALGGNLIDQALFGANKSRHVEVPRLSDLDIMARPRARRSRASMAARASRGR